MRRRAQRPHPMRTLVLVVAAMSFVTALTPGDAFGDAAPGSAGVDVSLPPTDSQVSVQGRGQFAGMDFTINQTKDLTNQAVSVHWTGGQPTRIGVGRYDANYVQVFQCWGDDDGTNPANPGPPPQQCEEGATIRPGGNKGFVPNGFALTRLISRTDWPNYDDVKSYGAVEQDSTNVWMPFKAVDGTVVNVPLNSKYNPFIKDSVFWLNPYFNIYSTNEVTAVATADNGEGGTRVQVVTGVESSGLGCGQKVQRATPDAQPTVPKCWLVIVPRGEPLDENGGTPFGADEAAANGAGVVTSPLAPTAWANRIAVPLEFNPVDSPCPLGAKERRIVGSELTLNAISSWQPALCATGGLPPYSYATLSDAGARQQLANPVPGAPGMVVVGRPLDDAQVDPSSPVVYAPLSVSGIGIGFNWERYPTLEAPTDEQKLAGSPIAQLNLTPRLVAKLLTQSYQSALPILSELPTDAAHAWLSANPSSMASDPDFVQWNPELGYLQAGTRRTVGGLSLPGGTSDVAHQLWQWVLADPEAKAWLDGNADQWGMKVNPAYSTNASINPSGSAFGDPAPEQFPKAEPYCYSPSNGGIPLCGTDWLPYVGSLRDAARATSNADDKAKIETNPSPVSAQDVWQAVLPQPAGQRSFLSVVDTSSAARFGIQMARLTAAGDDGASRSFIAADQPSLTAGAAALVPSQDASFLVPDPTKPASGAYPLTAVPYAAIKPLALDDTARAQYAAFLDYAAGPGQVLGLKLGNLPLGYAPLPAALEAQLKAAAQSVRDLQPTPPTGSSTTVSGPSASSSGQVSSSSGGGGGTSKTVTPAAVLPAAAPVATSNSSSGAPPSSGQATPIVAIGGSRFAFVGLMVLALASGLAALEITKRPRRALPDLSGPDRGVTT